MAIQDFDSMQISDLVNYPTQVISRIVKNKITVLLGNCQEVKFDTVQ